MAHTGTLRKSKLLGWGLIEKRNKILSVTYSMYGFHLFSPNGEFNMKVDVVMCTWNSNKPYFVRCLESIKREVPIHHFILIDRFSTDGTVEAVSEEFSHALIKRSNARLAFSRKLGIDLVDTEFFVCVDSHIELCDGWFKRIMNYVGSIQG